MGHTYRGQDRRGALPPAPFRPIWLLAWVLPVLVTVVAAPVVAAADTLGALALPSRPTWRAVTVALAIVLAVVASLLHRATGEVRALRLSVVATLLAAASLPASVVGTRPVRSVDALVVAGTAVAGWTALRLSGDPEVDTSLRAAPELLRAGALTVVAVLATLGADELLGAARVPALAAAVVTGLWALTTWRLVRRWRAGRATMLQAWLAGFTATVTVAEAIRGAALLVPGWLLTSALLRLVALVVITVAAVHLLTSSLEVRRSELHLLRAERVRGDREREHERQQLQHELRNVLMGLEAATSSLRGGRRLTDDHHEEVTAALATGLSRLRLLLLPEHDAVPTVVPIGEVVVPTALLARARGAQLLLDGDLDTPVRCVPGELAQALDNVFVNAEVHGDAREVPASVEISSARGRVAVRVSDRGPGVPPGLDEQIFAPGVTLSSAGGLGVGLALARRLVRKAGGELCLDAPPATGSGEETPTGAAFVLTLPVAAAAPAVDAGQEERDQLV